jgi:hypothetical protein
VEGEVRGRFSWWIVVVVLFALGACATNGGGRLLWFRDGGPSIGMTYYQSRDGVKIYPAEIPVDGGHIQIALVEGRPLSRADILDMHSRGKKEPACCRLEGEPTTEVETGIVQTSAYSEKPYFYFTLDGGEDRPCHFVARPLFPLGHDLFNGYVSLFVCGTDQQWLVRQLDRLEVQ